MCGCDDRCSCFSYDTLENIKYSFICFGIVAAVLLLVVLLAAYGFLRPISITVTDASLTRFALVTSQPAELAYNLTLLLTVRNRNWAMSMKNTKPFEATYFFDGQQFDRVVVASMGVKHPAGKIRVYHLATNSAGEYVSLGNAGVANYKKESAAGVFVVEVKLTGEVRYTARYTKCKLEATCPLKLQLAPPGSTATVGFQQVKCTLAKPEKNC